MSFFGKYYFASSQTLVAESGQTVRGLTRLPGKGGGQTWQPPTDVYQTDDGVVVLVELAGVNQADVEVRLIGDELVIRGVRRHRHSRRNKAYLQMEIHHGPFERVVPLPSPVWGRKARARLVEGLLEVFLPRARPAARPAVSVRIAWE